jgi:hypothetical protein
MLDEIKECKDSGFTKYPVFFQRYSNTQEQVLPAKKFDRRVLDFYFDELTNVTDKRAISIAKRHARQSEASLDNKSKVLIAKVLLISKYIPNIPHFLENVIGAPGSMKTNYLKFSKRLVDPGVTEVHGPPITAEDIHQKFAHNYYFILDNMGSIQKWLSDLICSVITGSGSESRKLHSNQGIVSMVLKSCVAVGSVNRVFIEPDALTRLVVQEFLEVNDEDASTEDVIGDKFEEIRPQILGCIVDILSKAIGIRHRIAGKYRLGRMADVLEWGEAISQAMGYEEGEFLRAYNNLISIQQRHTSDPLMIAYQRLFHRIFEDQNTSNFYVKEREDGYKIFNYGKLQAELNDIAEEVGKDRNWPKGSYQLTERSREISSRLRKLNISLEITDNEFVLGTIEGIEYYAKYGEAEKTICRCKHPRLRGTETCHYRNCHHSKEEHQLRKHKEKTGVIVEFSKGKLTPRRRAREFFVELQNAQASANALYSHLQRTHIHPTVGITCIVLAPI